MPRDVRARTVHGPGQEAVTIVRHTFLALAVLAAGPAVAAGDAARGAFTFRQCLACHALEPERHMTGPSLAGIWGRKAGSMEDFLRYSDALKRSGIVWSEKTLDAWLRDPAAMVPGNYMSYAGVPDTRARTDLIAYLRRVAEEKDARPAKPRGRLPSLKDAPRTARIAAIRHCRDTYFVTNAAGDTVPYWEFNLRFKTDSTATGPAPGQPVMVGSGMQGDRAQVVFSSPAEISSFVREQCPEKGESK